MRQWIRKNRIRAALFMLCAALLLIGYASFSLARIPRDFHYLWQAPPLQEAMGASGMDDTAGSALDASGQPGSGSQSPKLINAGLRDARESAKSVAEQTEGAIAHMTLFAIAAPTAVSVKDGNSAAARLEAIEPDSYALKTFDLFGGRLFYPEELERGERVCLLDEQLAVALFQYAEPLGRDIQIAGQSFRIMGIVRDHKQVGDEQEYSLYVPYRAMEKSSLPLTALCLQASPVPGSGGFAAFSAAVKSIGNGTLWNLHKEIESAFLPLRMLLVLGGMAVVFVFLRFWNGRFLGFIATYRDRLREQYAATLLPWLLGRGAVFLLGYGLAAFGFAQLFMLLINPVFTFPEWIPAVLVEPKDIATAFWNVWQGMAKLIELRSPELVRVQFYARLMAWAVGLLAVSCGVLWGRVMEAFGTLGEKE